MHSLESAAFARRTPHADSCTAATRDGEVVVCDEAGVADFERLHGREHDRVAFLYTFDLLELDGVDVRPLALAERKDRLRQLLEGCPPGIQFNDQIEGDGAPAGLNNTLPSLRIGTTR